MITVYWNLKRIAGGNLLMFEPVESLSGISVPGFGIRGLSFNYRRVTRVFAIAKLRPCNVGFRCVPLLFIGVDYPQERI